jgi:hypothetical protein
MPYQKLDLEKVTLYGWEPVKSVKKIAKMVEGVLLGEEIPPVQILNTSQGLILDPFHIINQGSIALADGGHNRALAHYILGVPLMARIMNSNRPHKRRLIPISEIELRNLPEMYSRRNSRGFYR